MSRWIRRIVLLSLLVLASAVLAAPARAGGPTSALLSAPGIPKVVGVGYQDPRYEQLLRLIDFEVGRNDSAAESVNGVGPFVRATWLIHDMSVWRLDVIYPEAPGGPLIATTVDHAGTGKLPDQPVWHRATDPAALLKLLGSMGLLGGQPGGGPTGLPGTGFGDDGTSTSGATGDSVEGSGADQNSAAAGTASSGNAEDDAQGPLSGWRWMIPGFLLGAITAVVAARLLPSRRWELIDAD